MKLINSENLIQKPLVWLEVSKQGLLQNVAEMKRLMSGRPIMAVLKANAYGFGVSGVAKIIEAEVDAFGVVGIAEAVSLRQAGIRKPIMNLGIYSSDDAELLLRNDIAPTLFTNVALNDFAAAAAGMNCTAAIWIKVDTGLNRLGIPYNDAAAFIAAASALPNLTVAGVYSTLTEDPAEDRAQLQRFLAIKMACQNMPVGIWSLASSQAAFLFPESCVGMVRLGISLFGYYPSIAAQQIATAVLEPAASLKTRVACVKELDAGETVGYKKRFVANGRTRVAVLLPGYTYGLDPRLAKGGQVIIRGQKYPLVGGLTLTNCFADIGSNTNIQANDEAVLVGAQDTIEISVEEIGALLNQSPYEFFSRIPEKVQRVYV